jgi:uncharacterized membrane protein
MTVGDWLASREPAPPPRLTARVVTAVGSRIAEPAERAADVCLDACESLLAEIAARPSQGRESALDLLAADALATYSLEAAAESPGSLEERARQAMKRLAAIAAE